MKGARALLWLLVLVPLALGIARLRFDVEVLNLLPERLDAAQGLRVYQQHFADARELILTLQARDSEEAQASARALAGVLRSETNLVAEVTWQPAWMENPAQAVEWIAFLWLNQPPAVLGELKNRLAPHSAHRHARRDP